jgi:hypothetical protein
MLGTRIHNVHLSNKLQSINTYGGNKWVTIKKISW